MRATRFGPKDLYAVLEVAPTASEEVIHAAHRTLAKQYHPDRAAGNASLEAAYTERMKDLNEARRVLGDSGLRREYDRQRAAASEPVASEPVATPQTRAATPAARPSPAAQRPSRGAGQAAPRGTRHATPAAAAAAASRAEVWLGRGIQAVGTGIASWFLLWLSGWAAWKILEAFLASF